MNVFILFDCSTINLVFNDTCMLKCRIYNFVHFALLLHLPIYCSQIVIGLAGPCDNSLHYETDRFGLSRVFACFSLTFIFSCSTRYLKVMFTITTKLLFDAEFFFHLVCLSMQCAIKI